MLYYEDLVIGHETVFKQEYRVTQEEIIEVAKRWDPQPFHIDPVAAKDSMFGGLVASSAHIFSIWVSFGRTKIDEGKVLAAVSALGFDKLRWHAPVRPNDVLRVGHIITEIRESKSKPGLGIVTIANRVFNQNDETVFTLENTFLIPKKGAGE
jgi:acyl dehydratase